MTFYEIFFSLVLLPPVFLHVFRYPPSPRPQAPFVPRVFHLFCSLVFNHHDDGVFPLSVKAFFLSKVFFRPLLASPGGLGKGTLFPPPPYACTCRILSAMVSSYVPCPGFVFPFFPSPFPSLFPRLNFF